jgi:hypothetical protein
MAVWDDYAFIDCETAGLNFREHALLEMTYAIGLAKPVTLYPADIQFALRDADPAALAVNHFVERFSSDDERGAWVEVPDGYGDPGYLGPGHYRWMNIPESTEEEWETFRQAIKGKYWVGANARFDVNFVEEYFAPQPLDYHYHLFDVRSWWAGRNWTADLKSKDKFPAFEAVATTKADHTSLNDVRSLRQAFSLRVMPEGRPKTHWTTEEIAIHEPESETY